jgi:hypothetical protein
MMDYEFVGERTRTMKRDDDDGVVAAVAGSANGKIVCGGFLATGGRWYKIT